MLQAPLNGFGYITILLIAASDTSLFLPSTPRRLVCDYDGDGMGNKYVEQCYKRLFNASTGAFSCVEADDPTNSKVSYDGDLSAVICPMNRSR